MFMEMKLFWMECERSATEDDRISLAAFRSCEAS